jgi:hypothetical protein
MMFLVTIINAAFTKGKKLPHPGRHYAWYVIIPALLIVLIWLGKKMF